jgi:hypothetical protein
MTLWKTGTAALPVVRMRKVTAIRSRKGSWDRDSCIKPKRVAESGGNARREMVPRDGRGSFLAGDGEKNGDLKERERLGSGEW